MILVHLSNTCGLSIRPVNRYKTVLSQLSPKLFHSSISRSLSSSSIQSLEEVHSHVFLRLTPWKTIKHFSKSLINNVLYSTDGLVMVNKPYGVGIHVPTHSQVSETAYKLNATQMSSCSYTLSQSLPHLAEAMGYASLTVVKAPERYTSGVTILSASDEVTQRVRQCLKRSKPTKQRTEHYLAVAVGVPNQKEATNKFGLTLKTDETLAKKYPILLTDWSKRAVSRGEIKLATVDHRTLSIAANNLASLLELHPSTTRWHFLRIYLTYLLSPVLGDHMYGSRVAEIMGVPMLINPASENASMPQKLNTKLLEALCLRSGQESVIPTHIHLQSQRLIGYDNGTDLTVTAPLPESFKETCRLLELNVPANSTAKLDS